MQILELYAAFSVTTWEAVIKRAPKLTLIKNVLNPRALWRGIISVPPLFFHILTDRDVDFINALDETALPRLPHVLLGKLGGGYELDMEALSRSWDTGVDWGRTGVQSIFPYLRSYCYGAERRLYPQLFFMNVCSPSVPAKLPFQRSEQVNASVNKLLGWLQIQSKKIKSQISNYSMTWFSLH